MLFGLIATIILSVYGNTQTTKVVHEEQTLLFLII